MPTNVPATVHYLPECHRGPCNIGPDKRRTSCGILMVSLPEDLPLGVLVYGPVYAYRWKYVTCPACRKAEGLEC